MLHRLLTRALIRWRSRRERCDPAGADAGADGRASRDDLVEHLLGGHSGDGMWEAARAGPEPSPHRVRTGPAAGLFGLALGTLVRHTAGGVVAVVVLNRRDA